MLMMFFGSAQFVVTVFVDGLVLFKIESVQWFLNR